MKLNKYILFLAIGIVGILVFWYIAKYPSVITPIAPSAPGSSFVFDIEADPHMDEQSSEAIFTQSIKNIIADKPSFLIDLGDTFMLDKQPTKNNSVFASQYQKMKKYFDLLGPSIPLYLVSGNHDGETGWESNNRNQRLQYFPSQFDKNYYSFTKSDALFVVLDPYTYTTVKPSTDGWKWTLGKTQYDWLKNTLESSKARYKFVFIHQLVGGDSQGRGGVEFAKLYEWGGNNADGSYGFSISRTGWSKPIHKLLVDNKVNAVFKGHDHFYTRQELDGVIYQTLPQPSHPGDKVNTQDEYGYTSGDVIGGSGYLRVTVSAGNAKVEFVKTLLGKTTESISDTYILQGK